MAKRERATLMLLPNTKTMLKDISERENLRGGMSGAVEWLVNQDKKKTQ